MCRDHEVDGEVLLVDEFRSLEDALELEYAVLEGWDDLRPNCLNVASWYDQVVEAFEQATLNFRSEVSLANERQKHHPPSSARSAKDLARASKSGESVLAFGLLPDVVGMFARSMEVEFFDELVGGSSYRGAVNCLTDVGFEDGRSTQFLAVEWAYPAIHAYPISKREARDIVSGRGTSGADDCDATHQNETTIPADDTLQGYARVARGTVVELRLDDLDPSFVVAPRSDGRPTLTAGDLQKSAEREKECADLRRRWPYAGQVEIGS